MHFDMLSHIPTAFDARAHWYTHAFQDSYIPLWASDAFCDLRYRFLRYAFRLGRSVTMSVYISARVVIWNACIQMNAYTGAFMHFRSRISGCGPLTRSAMCGDIQNRTLWWVARMMRVGASIHRIMHVYLVAFMLILVFLVCTWQVRLRVEGGPRGTSRPHKWFQQPNISLGRIRMLFSGFVAFYKRGKKENFACFVEVRAIAVYLYKFKLCKSIQNFHSQLPSNFHFDPRS